MNKFCPPPNSSDELCLFFCIYHSSMGSMHVYCLLCKSTVSLYAITCTVKLSGSTWPGYAWPGYAWPGNAWPGYAWPGHAWLSSPEGIESLLVWPAHHICSRKSRVSKRKGARNMCLSWILTRTYVVVVAHVRFKKTTILQKNILFESSKSSTLSLKTLYLKNTQRGLPKKD